MCVCILTNTITEEEEEKGQIESTRSKVLSSFRVIFVWTKTSVDGNVMEFAQLKTTLSSNI